MVQLLPVDIMEAALLEQVRRVELRLQILVVEVRRTSDVHHTRSLTDWQSLAEAAVPRKVAHRAAEVATPADSPVRRFLAVHLGAVALLPLVELTLLPPVVFLVTEALVRAAQVVAAPAPGAVVAGTAEVAVLGPL
jgi:hypothetical protein